MTEDEKDEAFFLGRQWTDEEVAIMKNFRPERAAFRRSYPVDRIKRKEPQK